jgi:hypothetical protein
MRFTVAIALLSISFSTFADDFDFSPVIAQQDFTAIAEDLSASLGYKALGPAEAGGITGFSVGAFAAYAPTESPEAWQRVAGTKVDATGLVGLIASKGLPFDIDVGALYAEVPNTSASLTGFELRYALLAGSAVSPALALRASYSKLSGVDDFDFKSQGIDLSLSKGFLIASPYAGIGLVKTNMRLKGVTVTGGDNEEEVEETRLFAGLRLSLLPLIAITPEFERVGKVSSYNLRVGVSF